MGEDSTRCKCCCGRPPTGASTSCSTLPGALLGQEPLACALSSIAVSCDVQIFNSPCIYTYLSMSVGAQGGEAEGLARLQYYLWDSDRIAEYFETRNGMVGGDYSTKFSPWLAAGCLSPRRVYHEVRRYERTRTENKSTYWVLFELIWRDYFRFFAVKHGSKLFAEGGIIGKQLQWTPDSEVCIREARSRASIRCLE